MKWSNFESQFSPDWGERIKPFIESEECDKIYAHLKQRSKRGHTIAPSSSNVFRCFRETPYSEMKAVFMGMAPYHTMFRGINGNVMIADGLLMGCSNTNFLQPSLSQFYGAIRRETDAVGVDSPDVSYLAKQGVLMLNASLTTELNKAGSHMELWEPFTKWLMENILSYSGVPLVFMGKDAAAYERYSAPFQWTFVISHPASAAYKGTEWNAEDVFNKVNRILFDCNGMKIQWLKDA